MSAATKWTHPFDDLSDEEFYEHVEALFAERPRTVAVSLRVSAGLLERLKRQATRMGLANQTLVKSVLKSPSLVCGVESHRTRIGHTEAEWLTDDRLVFALRNPRPTRTDPEPLAMIRNRTHG